jgi:hypothetical protein
MAPTTQSTNRFAHEGNLVSFPVLDTRQYRSDQQRNVPFVAPRGAVMQRRRCPTTPATRCSAPKQRSWLLKSVEQIEYGVECVLFNDIQGEDNHPPRAGADRGKIYRCGQTMTPADGVCRRRSFVSPRLVRNLHRNHRYSCDAVAGGGLDWPLPMRGPALECTGPDRTVVHQGDRSVLTRRVRFTQSSR